MEAFEQFVQRVAAAFGLRIARINRPPVHRPPSPLVHHGIDLLLDVGANVGQYAMRARAAGYTGDIVSFEPLPVAHAALLEAARDDPRWRVHPRCAVGAAPGSAEINVASNSFSSSLLPMLDAHADAAPHSVYVGKTLTEVVTLDAVIDGYRRRDQKVFLKVDTQGFEAQVLDGARATLEHVVAVQLELSLVPLYAGQQLYRHFLDFFAARGFELWSLEEGFVDPRSGRMLQFDAVFARGA